MLGRIDEFYWRGRALESVLALGEDEKALAQAAAYPAELIFAIRRINRLDLKEHVVRLVDDFADDARVVTGAIQTFSQLHLRSELAAAVRTGRRILTQERDAALPALADIRVAA